MKQLLATTFFVAASASLVPALAADSTCGRVTVANMNWQSAELIAWVDKAILENGYGCDVSLVPGDTQPTFTSMTEKGEPDIAPEGWINAMREPLDRAVAEGKLLYAVEALGEGGVEGWWIPDYVAEANPDIKTIDDALKRPELFPDPEDPSRGAVHNCPSGWNCQVTTGNFFKAYEADKRGFNLLDTGSAAGLDGSIAKAYERKQPWLGYYWAPTAILGKYKLVRLDFDVPYDEAEWNACTTVANCETPKKNAWSKSVVFTVVTKAFADRAGPAYDYIKARSFPTNGPINEMLAWMADNQATGEEAARYFLKEKADIWTQWVPAEVAEKVKAAL